MLTYDEKRGRTLSPPNASKIAKTPALAPAGLVPDASHFHLEDLVRNERRAVANARDSTVRRGADHHGPLAIADVECEV